MLSWAMTFLVIALIAAVLGFSGLAGTASSIAWILFVVFLIAFLVSLVLVVRYLATGESQRVEIIKADVPGLALPREVIDKIYYDNAKRAFAL